MRTARKSLSIAVTLLLTAAVYSWSAAVAPPNLSHQAVSIKDGLITMQARNLPMRDVLQNIATQANVEIVVQGSVEQTVSADFSRTVLEEALRRITQDFNSVFMYGTQQSGQSRPPIEKVLLYAKTAPGSKANAQVVVFRPGSTLPVKITPQQEKSEQVQIESEEAEQPSIEAIVEQMKSNDPALRQEPSRRRPPSAPHMK
ncbi:MAG: hypothetical protein CDV28_13014 [Candidatus Electronema aureum]|uniref:Uncharacterized protein n=1 Tax=Candidatus Electronema aureum TaxID=2005002 RepID=A0A521FZW5_9BACT|nr:MAG: hypothetical protein CDV28_13014 [Candidatus Electronema aureum]